MQIVTDCAADLSPSQLTENNIILSPMFIQFPEGEVMASDITPDDFYNRLEAMRPAVPTTAQASAGQFAQIYRTAALSDPQILSIHVSSGLSGTLNSAHLGGQQAAPQAQVTFWDSLTLSGAQGFQVLAAAHMARLRWSMEAILERLAAIRAASEVIYTLETLEYLARGGRIGRVQALAGILLNLKPVIRVEHTDGKYSTVAKTRTLPKALNTITEHLQQMYTGAEVWVNVLHGRFAEQAETLAGQLSKALNIARIEVNRISPVLGVHTGPGIVGAAVVPMRLMEDLLAP